MIHRLHPHPRASRPGSAFVITIWTLAALTGLVLAVGHAVRVEAEAAADHMAMVQATAALDGAEQFVLSAVDTEVATPGATTTDDMLDAMSGFKIGDAWVYIIKPDPDDETALSFGLTDEASKLDINSASPQMLQYLPNITQDIVDSIVDWRDADSTPGNQGAEDPYYTSLPIPYHCKNLPFETVDELLLVKGIDVPFLFGSDTARAGRTDSGPASAPSDQTNTLGGALSTNISDRGIYPFVTVYGLKASTAPSTTAASSLTGGGVLGASTKPADVNSQDQTVLRTTLQKYLSGDISQVLTSTSANRPFINIWDWATRINLTQNQFSQIIQYVTANPAPAVAKININTAPKQTLMCLPGFTEADADAIVAYRQANPTPTNPADISWLLTTITPPNKLANAGFYLTGISSCFSADILTTNSNGRAFKRERIVVDASSGTAKIIYRRDMTAFGWPLPPEYRDDLRTGQAVPSSIIGAP